MILVARSVTRLPFEDACETPNSSGCFMKFVYLDGHTFDAHMFIERLGFRIARRHEDLLRTQCHEVQRHPADRFFLVRDEDNSVSAFPKSLNSCIRNSIPPANGKVLVNNTESSH